MSKQLCAALVVACVAMATSPSSEAAALAKPTCRTTDKTEAGFSGSMTSAELAAGPAVYKCNIDLVGQYQGEGASWQLTAWKNCAYFDQRNNGSAGSTTEAHPGVAVLDVSDPTHPTATTWLATEAMIDPWESLKVNPARQLLAGDQRPLSPPGFPTSPGGGFDVYDISADCKHPVLKTDPGLQLPNSVGHTGQWAPDGKSYYVTPLRNDISIVAVDTTDPAHPTVFTNGAHTFTSSELPTPRIHDLEFSKDGNTAYITMLGNPNAATPTQNGFAIIDVSDFQSHTNPNPQYRVLSFLTWDDGSTGAQNALFATIAGKPYVIFADEGAGIVATGGCPQNKSGSGFPRIIDISDPKHPTVVSKIQLGVHDPANCPATFAQPVTSSVNTSGAQVITEGGFGFSCHYCNVDNIDDAKILGCSCFAAGFRVFDIHDPLNPKEMAYYKPKGQGTKVLPGSQYANSNNPASFVRNYDWTTAKVSFPQDRGATSGDIWITSQDNGFQVVHLFSTFAVSPTSINTGQRQTEKITATITGAAATAGANWSIQEGAAGGTVDPDGTYHSPPTAGTYHVVASPILDSSLQQVVTINVAGHTGTSYGCGSAEGTAAFGALALLVLAFRRRMRRA